MNKTPILSFFSGGGFLDLGFEKAGFDTVWSNEYEKTFIEIFHHGMTSWSKNNGHEKDFHITNTKSVTEINSNELIQESFNNLKPDLFGMIGGPPCQDFSLNGRKNGFNGERGKLTNIYINLILEVKPTFFLMENVPGLVDLKSTKPFFNKLIDELKEYYYIEKDKINAINYGTPQSRERIIVIGFLKEKLKDQNHKYKWPIITKYNNALLKFNWPKTNSFGEKISKSPDIPLELCVESCLKKEGETTSNIDEYFKFREGKTNRFEIQEGETTRPSFKRLHRYRYSPTTMYGNNEVHLHPYEDRRISLREALRIQGVPDSYVLPKEISLSKKFKVVSNGVPVPLAYHLANSIKKYLDKNII